MEPIHDAVVQRGATFCVDTIHIGTISEACFDYIFRSVLTSDMKERIPCILFVCIYVEMAVIWRVLQKTGKILDSTIADLWSGFFKRGAHIGMIYLLAYYCLCNDDDCARWAECAKIGLEIQSEYSVQFDSSTSGLPKLPKLPQSWTSEIWRLI